MKRIILRLTALIGFVGGTLAVLAWSAGSSRGLMMSLATLAFVTGGIAAGLLDAKRKGA